MLIKINILILDMVSDLILVHFFSLLNFDWGKNFVIFGVHNSSSVHTDNKRKGILVLGEGPTQGQDDTTKTPIAKYSISFRR